MSLSKFYMVKGNGPSSFKWETYGEAETEARRLAAFSPGIPFFVLEAIKVVVHQHTKELCLRNVSDRSEVPF
jgi:hypothetical protein